MEMNTDTSQHMTQYEKTIQKLKNVRKHNEKSNNSSYFLPNSQNYTNSRRYNNLCLRNTLNTNTYNKIVNEKNKTNRENLENININIIYPKTDRNYTYSKDVMYNKQREYFASEEKKVNSMILH